MNRILVLGSAVMLTFGAAGTASAQSANHILRGAGIGAAGGVIAGAVIPGLGVGEGALIGAAGGTLYNTLINKEKRRYYRGSKSKSPTYSRSASSEPRYRSYRAN